MMGKYRALMIGILIVVSGFSGLLFSSQAARGTELSGTIASQTWNTAGSPYYITGDLTISAGEIVQIVPDTGPVEVVFNGSYSIFAQGSLFVNGTETNYVNFTSNSGTPLAGDWTAITAVGPNGNIHMRNASIMYAITGVVLETGGNTIMDSKMNTCQNYGVFINTADSNLVQSTEIQGCTDGIRITGSDQTILRDVNIHDNSQYGIFLTGSENNTIENSVINDNWLEAVHSEVNSHTLRVSNTTCDGNGNGGPVTTFYIWNSDFSTMKNCTISNTGSGIFIWDSDKCKVQGSNITATNNFGIPVTDSDNVTLQGNEIFECSGNGIQYQNSNGGTITENDIVWCQFEIEILGSNHNNIDNNTLRSGNYAARLRQNGCHNNTFENNVLVDNVFSGLTLGSGAVDNVVRWNEFGFNSGGAGVGITTGQGLRTTITRNLIRDQTATGISLSGSAAGNWVYHNDFVNNSVHASDSTGANFWNLTYSQAPLQGGNYWDNYTGVDNNSTATQDTPPSDGIGDTPYVWIQGGTGMQDYYPFMEPFFGIPPESSVDPISPYWHNANAVITATANDTGSGVGSVSLYFSRSTDNVTFGPFNFYIDDGTAPWSWDFTFPSGDGYYDLYTRTTDNSANVEDAPLTADQRCGFDATAPTSAVNGVLNYTVTTGPLAINSTASDATSGVAGVAFWFRFSADNATWSPWASTGSDSSAPYGNSFNYPNGTGYYEFYSVAIDVAGNSEAAPGTADTSCFYNGTVPDTIAPISSVDYIPGIWITAINWAVNATASDSESGIHNVSLYYRFSASNTTGGMWELYGVDSAAPYSWIFGFADGPGYYEFHSIAVDNAGNVEAAPSGPDAICKQDDIEPFSEMEQPARYWWSHQGLNMNTTAVDIGSGIDDVTRWYRHSMDNATWGNWTQASGNNFPDGEGYYQFYTTCVDNAGLSEAPPAEADVYLAYDNTAPSITDRTAPNGTTGQNFTFTAIVADDFGIGDVTIQYTIGTGSQVNATMTFIGGEYQLTILVPAGTTSIVYKVSGTDLAGNWGTIPEKTAVFTEPDDDDDDDDDDEPEDDTGIPSWLWIILILIIALGAVFLFLMMGRRKPDQMVEEMDKQDGYEDSEEAEEEAEEDAPDEMTEEEAEEELEPESKMSEE